MTSVKRTRKKRVKPIARIEDMPNGILEAYVTHLEKNFPTSGQLVTFKKEMQRRASGSPSVEATE